MRAANKGIGYHIAAQLVASRLFGTVILACRDPTRGMAAAKEAGGEYLPLTVGDPASAEAFAASVQQKYGRCDVLMGAKGPVHCRVGGSVGRGRRKRLEANESIGNIKNTGIVP